MARLHVVVTGRVQGVGFRWFVRREATRLGVSGWASNRPDGSVEVAADGSVDAIAALQEAIAQGPDGARVDAVGALPTDKLGELSRPFEIRR